jgi:hypothetical protein
MRVTSWVGGSWIFDAVRAVDGISAPPGSTAAPRDYGRAGVISGREIVVGLEGGAHGAVEEIGGAIARASSSLSMARQPTGGPFMKPGTPCPMTPGWGRAPSLTTS